MYCALLLCSHTSMYDASGIGGTQAREKKHNTIFANEKLNNLFFFNFHNFIWLLLLLCDFNFSFQRDARNVFHAKYCFLTSTFVYYYTQMTTTLAHVTRIPSCVWCTFSYLRFIWLAYVDGARLMCFQCCRTHTLLLFSPTLSGCASNYKIIRIIISENGKANTILSRFSSHFFFLLLLLSYKKMKIKHD